MMTIVRFLTGIALMVLLVGAIFSYGLQRGPDGAQGVTPDDQIDLRFLVIAGDGNEAAFPAIKSSLDYLGIPYDVLTASQTPLTAARLSDGQHHAYYEAVILVTNSLAYQVSPGVYDSAFDAAEWQTLWDFEARFGIRQVSYYTFPGTFPESSGLELTGTADTSSTCLTATLTAAGRDLFTYLNPTASIPICHAWTYLAQPLAGATPLLVTPAGNTVAALYTYPNGRQNLALTMDQAPHLIHSVALSYGIVNWAARGLFIGERHVFQSPQIDDIFINNDIWDPNATQHPEVTGITYRATDTDIAVLLQWLQAKRASDPELSELELEFAFNGEGTVAGEYVPDALTPYLKTVQGNFNWLNHTYTHMNLDAATQAQTTSELAQNNDVALDFPMTNYFRDSMVQPDVSGLNSPNAMLAAYNFGIRYLVSDTSRLASQPKPNTGTYNARQPGMLEVPRYPTNIFYNVTNPTESASEYNYIYRSYWGRNLTYQEILDFESNFQLLNMLRYNINPYMYHQSNVRAYDGQHSLLSDTLDMVLAKYNALYNLPVLSPSQHEIGVRMKDRMNFFASGVTASVTPGADGSYALGSVTLTSPRAARVPVTGIVGGDSVEFYGGQPISYFNMTAGQTRVIKPPALYFTVDFPTTVGGLSVDEADIIYADGQGMSIYFDGSDVGLAGFSLENVARLNDGSLLLALQTSITLPGLAADVAAGDIVRFTPTSLGPNTAGTYSLYFDGSDVGLTGGTEAMDALEALPDGRILISTTGAIDVPGVIAADEDVVAFTPTTLGANTAGTWALYFDGSAVGLGEADAEDPDGLAVAPNGDIYLTTTGNNAAVTGLTAQNEDVFICKSPATGATTSCVSFEMYFDGSVYGLAGSDINGLELPPVLPAASGTQPTSTPTNTPTSTSTPTWTPTSTSTFTPGPSPTSTFTPTPTFTPVPPPSGSLLLAVNEPVTLSGLAVTGADVVLFNGTAYSMVFDGSDVGLTTQAIDGLARLPDGSLLLSFQAATTVTGIAGPVEAQDIVQFVSTSLGDTTAGTFSLYFDGSDVGLTGNAERIDALDVLPDGRLLISTTGAIAVTGVSGEDDDIVAFAPTSLGATTAGAWTLYFDGNGALLNNADSEDPDGLAVAANGDIDLSSTGQFSVTGLSGRNEDVFSCNAPTLGATTVCASYSMQFDGSLHGLTDATTNNDVQAIEFP